SLDFVALVVHSLRSKVMGSTDSARLAGIHVANSPAGRNIDSLAALKRWNQSFTDAFRPRTDLVDHFVAGDRGLVTINLHWKHDRPFNGLAPTGKTGTSVEN